MLLPLVEQEADPPSLEDSPVSLADYQTQVVLRLVVGNLLCLFQAVRKLQPLRRAVIPRKVVVLQILGWLLQCWEQVMVVVLQAQHRPIEPAEAWVGVALHRYFQMMALLLQGDEEEQQNWMRWIQLPVDLMGLGAVSLRKEELRSWMIQLVVVQLVLVACDQKTRMRMRL